MITLSVADFAEIVVDVTAGLATQSDPLEFLQVFTHRVAAVVDLSVVGLLAAEGKGPPHAVASDENSERLALFQLQSQEGPCLDAFQTAEPVVMADLRTLEAPWPRFAPHAVTAGYRSVHAFPLGPPRSTAFGAVGLFGSNVGVLGSTDVQVVRALTDVAAAGLLQQRAIRRNELLATQLQHALNSRIVIEQAKGVIAQAHRIDVDTAFELIRTYARRSNRRLADIAGDVVAGLTNLPSSSHLTDGGPIAA